MRKKFLLLKEIPGERSSLWSSMIGKCKIWNFCSRFGTMKGARLGLKLEPWKAEQKERRTQIPEGEWHCWISEPHQLCFGLPYHGPFQSCKPINPLHFSSQFELGFFISYIWMQSWLSVNSIETWRKKNIASSRQPTIKSRHIMKVIGPAWQCFKWPSSPPDRGDRLC